jgi:methylphosphotriester-DNA--protein-cysteine methyltransferase
MKQAFKIQQTVWEFFYEDKSEERVSMTPTEFAGFKRSKRYKKLLSKKKIAVIDITIKTL